MLAFVTGIAIYFIKLPVMVISILFISGFILVTFSSVSCLISKYKSYVSDKNKWILIFYLLVLAGYFNISIKDNNDKLFMNDIIEKQQSVYIKGKIDSIKVGMYSDKIMLKQCECFVVGRDKKSILNNVVVEVEDAEKYARGDIITVEGVVTYFNSADNPGGFDEKSYYQSLGYRYYLKSPKISLVKKNENIFIIWSERIKVIL